MQIELVECLDWPAENRPGVLAWHAQEFKKRKVNFDALWSYEHDRRGKIAAIGKDKAALRRALKSMGIQPKTSRCFYITGQDKVGALVEVLDRLAAAGINVECSDALAAQGKFAATLWVRDEDLSKARKLLEA